VQGVAGDAASPRGSRIPNTTRPLSWFSKVTRWPTNFLRGMINEQTAWARKDFTGTGLKKPVRAKCASPRASQGLLEGAQSRPSVYEVDECRHPDRPAIRPKRQSLRRRPLPYAAGRNADPRLSVKSKTRKGR
jgi:hypothetical protein